MNMARFFFICGAILGFFGVAAGAFGAHTLRSLLTERMLAVFETAVRYQMYHAFALFAAGWGILRSGHFFFRAAGWMFLTGVGLFSGSLYVMVFASVPAAGIVTPFGGVAFLLGWAFLIAGFTRIR